MAVKMRLMRMGKKKSPYYRVVVVDGRAPRDGRYLDLIGRYDPREKPSLVEIDGEKAVEWLRKGAQPTETVAKLLEVSGTTSRFKVASGRIHTVAHQQPAQPEAGESEAAVAEEAEAAEPAAVPEEGTESVEASEAGPEEE